MKNVLLLIARVIIVPVFAVTAISDIAGFTQSQAYMAQHGIPLTGILLAGAIAFRLLGSLFILLGILTRIGVLLLVVFLISATLVFHCNWGSMIMLVEFWKNSAIIGGLLILWISGPGRIALRK